MAVARTPWGGSITLTVAHTIYQLSARLLALPAANRPNIVEAGTAGNAKGPPKVYGVTIQNNIANGGATLYIGNEDVSDGSGLVDATASVNCMCSIVATQVYPVPSNDLNLCRLDHIYLMSDTASTVVNIGFVTR